MKKLTPDISFSLVCIGVAVIFAALGILAAKSSLGFALKAFYTVGAFASSALYFLIAWKCRPRRT